MNRREPNRLFTIGHSNHAIEDFIALLEQHSVDCIADVRSAPYSRHNPQFNRETLRDSLKAHDIGYVWLGRELGARAEDEGCYIDGRVSFSKLAASPLFLAGIERLIEGSRKFTVAMMCAEREPLNCHRTILVSRHLITRGISIEHILGDGGLEPHRLTLDRLIELVGLEKNDLFRSADESIEEAYRLREREVAHRADRHQPN